MTIMYVDDSGTPRHTDHTDYFVLAGVIVRDEYIKKLQRSVFDYNQSNFYGNFIDSEVRVYTIHNSQNEFKPINRATKTRLLDNLYNMIKKLTCVGIIIVIDKNKLREKSSTEILDLAWTLLLERYDMFLRDNSLTFGQIKIYASSDKTQSLIFRTYRRLTSYGIGFRVLSHIKEPVFVDSGGVYGIQAADTFAYCTLKYIKGNVAFSKYWEIISSKLRKDTFGTIQGYGYKKYPT